MTDELRRQATRRSIQEARKQITKPTDPAPECVARVVRDNPRRSKLWVLRCIATLHRGNLICLDCGSENHTRGHELCSAGAVSRLSNQGENANG